MDQKITEGITRWTFFRSQARSERVLENTLSLRRPLNLGTLVTCYLYSLASLLPVTFIPWNPWHLWSLATLAPPDLLTF